MGVSASRLADFATPIHGMRRERDICHTCTAYDTQTVQLHHTTPHESRIDLHELYLSHLPRLAAHPRKITFCRMTLAVKHHFS
jgi:hypothetical protein